LPKRSGKLKTLNKFDAAFFGVNPKQANSMDPQLRMLLEVTYEAVVDSGSDKRVTIIIFKSKYTLVLSFDMGIEFFRVNLYF
jgi:hypothetical protein